MALSKAPIHPGIYTRESILPVGMSVTEAAKRLGIGRPALSNFLNGKSALSSEMAVRLGKAFGADQNKLLEMQSAYDQQKRRAIGREVVVRAFVPGFLVITAEQIEGWADLINSRSLLPVLLRKLVHSTGIDLQHVDFPGYDNAERMGSDGFVNAGSATPWIPQGVSYWEFGTNQNPGKKADADYAARLASVDPSERASSAFIFVTPRNWPGKVTWERRKNKVREWKSVRAFDASDLEQWLEQSVTAQIWLAEQLNGPSEGIETLHQVWLRWANASEPHLTEEIFAPSISAHRDTFIAWLNKPSERPFVIAADSRDEALAFLACLFNDEELYQFEDLAAVFTVPEMLRKLLASPAPFIPIVYSEEVERALGDAYSRLHCIVFRPRNAVKIRVDIALDLLDYEAFYTALTAIGIENNDIERLARESGRSPTILRRRLSKNAAIKMPIWASDDNTAEALTPMALIGAWHVESEADLKVVSYIADKKYDAVENGIARLLRVDDSPVWSAGRYRGVASKIDALFAIAKMMTEEDLNRFFHSAEYVLSESDPTLDLPEENRWAAALYGKKREHSDALREGICETLVILSVHGNNLFQDRLGIDLEYRVTALIRDLLSPFTLEKVLSHNRELPHYAEAAPNEFLKIIEGDLQSNDPVVFGLLKPVEGSSFLWGTPFRTGLLWALEGLAWKPQNLVRVSMILAQLSRTKINDNWSNKPDESLQAIYRSWMPQTAASVEERIKALELLTRRYSDVGWKIWIEQIKPGSKMGSYTYRPRWRSDASGVGQPILKKEMYFFNRKALDVLIAWPSHNERTLGELIESVWGMSEEDQKKVWDLIDEWSQFADESAKSVLRERIRQFALTKRGHNLCEDIRNRARKAYSNLRPHNAVLRHGWLFADHWVQESSEESTDDSKESFEYEKHEERIDRLRRNAMLEIWNELGFEGIKELLTANSHAGIVGHYMASCVTAIRPRADFAHSCLSLDNTLMSKADWCLQGFLLVIEDDLRTQVLKLMSEELPADARKRLFLCAPFRASTWRFLDDFDEDVRSAYWKEVIPPWGRYSPAELTEIIDRLLEEWRPRAAFHAVHMDFEHIETSRLKRLLREVVAINAEPVDHFKLEPYYISKALDSLDGRSGVTRDEMAQLEFFYIKALDESKHGIPNLEDQIAQSPQLFAQAVALVFKRSDDGVDPPELLPEDPEQRSRLASTAYHLLNQIKRIPGTNDNGTIDVTALAEWLAEVRHLCQAYARATVGDERLGHLLAKAPEDEDGTWPHEAVCKVMEEIASPGIGIGFYIEVHNSRGFHQRVNGGEEERELAAKYHARAERLRFDYPYVAGVIDTIAESYENEARREDSEASIEKRLHY